MDNQKCFSIIFVFAMAALLGGCNPVSSSFLPRITRTSDAIIIDFAVMGIAARHQGKNYGEIADLLGFITMPSINLFKLAQQSTIDKEWSYFYGHPSLATSRQNANPAQCGRGPITFPKSRSLIGERIADRSSTDKNIWPFMVTVASYFEGVVCGGTLIGDSKVLLATQCLQRMSISEMSFLTVLIGMQSNDVADAQITRRVTKIVLHSKFNAANFANDIAIITLDSPVIFSRTIASACLPPASADVDEYADQDAVILGWGGISSDTSTPFLQYGRVTIVSNQDCKAASSVGRFVTNTTMCTSPDALFTCSGDVGGPVVVLSSPGTWTVVGINSYFKDCVSNGLETRVSAFRAWIDTYIN